MNHSESLDFFKEKLELTITLEEIYEIQNLWYKTPFSEKRIYQFKFFKFLFHCHFFSKLVTFTYFLRYVDLHFHQLFRKLFYHCEILLFLEKTMKNLERKMRNPIFIMKEGQMEQIQYVRDLYIKIREKKKEYDFRCYVSLFYYPTPLQRMNCVDLRRYIYMFLT